MDLVIMAAGMGSRFGGLKQIEPIDEYGNFIIDYSIYDAIEAGFNRVIFIIKEENYETFKNTVGKRIEKYVETQYCFQSLDLIPNGIILPKERVKPLGTAQAVLSAKKLVSNKFLIINSDDYYGKDAFRVAANFLNSLPEHSKNKYGNIAFHAKNTITENGYVKRGIISTDSENRLISINESKIELEENKLMATSLVDNSPKHEIERDTLVSMNMIAFTSDFMNYIELGYEVFFEENKNNLLDCEYFLPSVVSKNINNGNIECNVLSTVSKWYGVTYKEDKEDVVKALKELVHQGLYPQGVWQK